MVLSEFDEHMDPKKPRKKSNRKAPKFFDQEDEDKGSASRKEKRSGKRFHRKKTHKDEFFDNDNSQD